jgi:hypothetical protein
VGAIILEGDGFKQTVIETATCPHHNIVVHLWTAGGRRKWVPTCSQCRDKRGQPRPVCHLCEKIELAGGNMHDRSGGDFEKKLDGWDRAARENSGLTAPLGEMRIRERLERDRFLRSIGL